MKLKTFRKKYLKHSNKEQMDFSWYDVNELLIEQEQNWQKITDKLRMETKGRENEFNYVIERIAKERDELIQSVLKHQCKEKEEP